MQIRTMISEGNTDIENGVHNLLYMVATHKWNRIYVTLQSNNVNLSTRDLFTKNVTLDAVGFHGSNFQSFPTFFTPVLVLYRFAGYRLPDIYLLLRLNRYHR